MEKFEGCEMINGKRSGTDLPEAVNTRSENPRSPFKKGSPKRPQNRPPCKVKHPDHRNSPQS